MSASLLPLIARRKAVLATAGLGAFQLLAGLSAQAAPDPTAATQAHIGQVAIGAYSSEAAQQAGVTIQRTDTLGGQSRTVTIGGAGHRQAFERGTYERIAAQEERLFGGRLSQMSYMGLGSPGWEGRMQQLDRWLQNVRDAGTPTLGLELGPGQNPAQFFTRSNPEVQALLKTVGHATEGGRQVNLRYLSEFNLKGNAYSVAGGKVSLESFKAGARQLHSMLPAGANLVFDPEIATYTRVMDNRSLVQRAWDPTAFDKVGGTLYSRPGDSLSGLYGPYYQDMQRIAPTRKFVINELGAPLSQSQATAGWLEAAGSGKYPNLERVTLFSAPLNTIKQQRLGTYGFVQGEESFLKGMLRGGTGGVHVAGNPFHSGGAPGHPLLRFPTPPRLPAPPRLPSLPRLPSIPWEPVAAGAGTAAGVSLAARQLRRRRHLPRTPSAAAPPPAPPPAAARRPARQLPELGPRPVPPPSGAAPGSPSVPVRRPRPAQPVTPVIQPPTAPPVPAPASATPPASSQPLHPVETPVAVRPSSPAKPPSSAKPPARPPAKRPAPAPLRPRPSVRPATVNTSVHTTPAPRAPRPPRAPRVPLGVRLAEWTAPFRQAGESALVTAAAVLQAAARQVRGLATGARSAVGSANRHLHAGVASVQDASRRAATGARTAASHLHSAASATGGTTVRIVSASGSRALTGTLSAARRAARGGAGLLASGAGLLASGASAAASAATAAARWPFATLGRALRGGARQVRGAAATTGAAAHAAAHATAQASARAARAASRAASRAAGATTQAARTVATTTVGAAGNATAAVAGAAENVTTAATRAVGTVGTVGPAAARAAARTAGAVTSAAAEVVGGVAETASAVRSAAGGTVQTTLQQVAQAVGGGTRGAARAAGQAALRVAAGGAAVVLLPVAAVAATAQAASRIVTRPAAAAVTRAAGPTAAEVAAPAARAAASPAVALAETEAAAGVFQVGNLNGLVAGGIAITGLLLAGNLLTGRSRPSRERKDPAPQPGPVSERGPVERGQHDHRVETAPPPDPRVMTRVHVEDAPYDMPRLDQLFAGQLPSP